MDVQRVVATGDNRENPQARQWVGSGGEGKGAGHPDGITLPQDSVQLSGELAVLDAEVLASLLEAVVRAIQAGQGGEAQRALVQVGKALQEAIGEGMFPPSSVRSVTSQVSQLKQAVESQQVPVVRQAYAGLASAIERTIEDGSQYHSSADNAMGLSAAVQALHRVVQDRNLWPGSLPDRSAAGDAVRLPTAWNTIPVSESVRNDPRNTIQAASGYNLYGLSVAGGAAARPGSIDAEPLPSKKQERRAGLLYWLLLLDGGAILLGVLSGFVPLTARGLAAAVAALVVSNAALLLLLRMFAADE